MQGKQKIIDDILQSARDNAAKMIAEAQAEVDGEIAALTEELKAAEQAELERYNAQAQAMYDGQVKLGELEAGKIMLKAKQDCVSAVYDGVRAHILKLPDAQYLKLLEQLIVPVCEDGDEIVACANDCKRVTAAWVKKLSTAAKKKLTLSNERGEFAGGVMLRNAKYDRDLTVDELVAELKERTVSDTVKALGL